MSEPTPAPTAPTPAPTYYLNCDDGLKLGVVSDKAKLSGDHREECGRIGIRPIADRADSTICTEGTNETANESWVESVSHTKLNVTDLNGFEALTSCTYAHRIVGDPSMHVEVFLRRAAPAAMRDANPLFCRCPLPPHSCLTRAASTW